MMKTLNSPSIQAKNCVAFFIAMTILLYVANSFADTLKDPTQPPALLNSESSVESETPTGPVLQSIMIGPQTHAAIINGEKVSLGQKYQTATLIKLNEHEAVLRYPDMTTQTLTMDFAMRKKLTLPVMDDSKAQQKIKQQSKPNTKTIEVSEK
jgi:MSHA biogenesis protein MshK